MSGETETPTEDVLGDTSVVALFQRYYHVPLLVALLAFMLWLRILPAEQFVRPDGVYFSGNDAWYHLRETTYAVYNWPFTMPFDPWTQFPTGASNDQFGTLYDQLVATAALVVGLGDPSQRQIATTLLYAPAVFGTLVAVPTYYIGRRLSGRFAGLFGVAVLAFLPGSFLRRSTAGFADHHAAEVLFQALAVLAFMVALRVAETEKPVYELLLDRDWDALERPAKYSVLAGVAISLYVWVWPPAIVLVGIIGTFFLVALGAKYAVGNSPDHIAFVGVVAMATVTVTSIVNIDELGFSPTSVSLLHVVLALGVAAGCAFLSWLGRQWDRTDYHRGLFPMTAISLALLAVGVFSVVLPDAFGSVRSNLLRTVALGQSDTTLTIGEAKAFVEMGPQYLTRVNRRLVAFYGLTYLTGAIGLGALVYRAVRDSIRAEYVFVAVWTVFIFLMALTQTRFNYYLVVPVAVLNAYLVGRLLRYADIDSDFEVSQLKTHHVSVVLAAVLLVLAPLAPINGIAMTSTDVHAQASGSQGPGGVTSWDSTTDWMQNGTPEPEGMEKYESYEKTDDFEYPDGAYGVMSWWDYGHWITVRGDRIPVANPFQGNAKSASKYFLTENETTANLMLEALPSFQSHEGSVDSYDRSDYQEMIESQTDQEASEDVRYVTIDYQMATRKFAAIATWTGPNSSEYFGSETGEYSFDNQTMSTRYTTFSDKYYDTMLAKLYWNNASGLEHYRLVHTSEEARRVATYSRVDRQSGQVVQQAFMNDLGALGSNRSLRNYFLLQRSPLFVLHDSKELVSVKTFERVEGANLTGSAPAGANVSVSLTLENTQTEREFTYEQTVTANEDGEFVVTVPYATNDAVSPEEGGTDSVVEAKGAYTVNVEDGGITTVGVEESTVLDGGSVTVEFSGTNASVASPDSAMHSWQAVSLERVDAPGGSVALARDR
jgi:dolichyl-diphosphooligosaccharide--protein glycosyltransferase